MIDNVLRLANCIILTVITPVDLEYINVQQVTHLSWLGILLASAFDPLLKKAHYKSTIIILLFNNIKFPLLTFFLLHFLMFALFK